MGDTKSCRHCGQDKPLIEFAERKDSKDGKRAQCNQCRKIKTKVHIATPVVEEPIVYFEHDPYYQF
jgi:hypothetical protein